jgi:hypothetical protein
MKKLLQPQRVIVSVEVEIDLNDLLDGYIINVPIPEIKKNIREYVMDEMKSSKKVPGDEITVTDPGAIVRNLHEWDLISSQDNE